jgi:putative ABC transport system substrate-binding protein
MRRRHFLSVLAGAAASGPLGARAQQPERMRRIGVLQSLEADDPESRLRSEAFRQALATLGWSEGRNVKFELRASAPEQMRKMAAELVALGPDIIVAAGTVPVGALLQTTRSIPIVFVQVVDPVGAGFVESLARPGGNVTGFTQFEYSISGKWLDLLKEIAPDVMRIGVVRDSQIVTGIGMYAVMQAVAPSLHVELTPINSTSAAELERAVTALAKIPNSGMIVTPSGTGRQRDRIIGLAATHRLIAVYPYRYYANSGGLISYGPDTIEQFRRTGGYVDRILKGEKPADLPVQAPTSYELVVNLKTAKNLGLQIPASVLGRADAVIE